MERMERCSSKFSLASWPKARRAVAAHGDDGGRPLLALVVGHHLRLAVLEVGHDRVAGAEVDPDVGHGRNLISRGQSIRTHPTVRSGATSQDNPDELYRDASCPGEALRTPDGLNVVYSDTIPWDGEARTPVAGWRSRARAARRPGAGPCPSMRLLPTRSCRAGLYGDADRPRRRDGCRGAAGRPGPCATRPRRLRPARRSPRRRPGRPSGDDVLQILTDFQQLVQQRHAHPFLAVRLLRAAADRRAACRRRSC